MSDQAHLTASAPPPVPGSALTAPPVERRLRLWPGVVLIALQWPVIKASSFVELDAMAMFATIFFVPIAVLAGISLWWLFASRLRWSDRLLGLAVFGSAAAVTAFFCHPSINPMAMIILGLPWATTAWVGWLVLTRSLSWPVRRLGLMLVMILAWGALVTLRFDGVTGSFASEVSWRWSPTAEQRFLAERAAAGNSVASVPAGTNLSILTAQPGDWPGFRGPNRDGRLKGLRVATDWNEHPPRQVWRHRVGPGWGSFSVIGSRLFTQEQRDQEEAVVCYDAATGKELWVHNDPVRFKEAISGPGPRATPTFHEGKIYSLGAEGILNCLEALTGNVVWSRDIKDDTEAAVPTWGFASSPLVMQGVVSVFAGGPEGKAVVGYDAATGNRAWTAGKGTLSYCSGQPAHLGGVAQLLMATDAGLTSFQPADGAVLWHHEWLSTNDQIARIIQPAILDSGDVLLGTGLKLGTQRVHVTHEGSAWTPSAVWTAENFKPYFSDLVVYQGHLYGFDGAFFTCVSLDDHQRRWRERGYGSGQVLLLEDQGLLLVLSEQGDVALIQAAPGGRKELVRFHAFDGKTWNHPVVAHGMLYVRNGEEAACFELRPEPTRVANTNP